MVFKNINDNFIRFVFVLFAVFAGGQIGAKDLKVLVFAAHPDDELIGCGGSMAKHLQLGNKVKVVYFTSGDAGSLKYSKQELAYIREKEAVKGLEVLGLGQNIETSFLKNKDGYLMSDEKTLIQAVEAIRAYKPDIVYLLHLEESHNDHKVSNDIVLKAINKARGNWFQEAKGEPWSVKTVLTYEISPMQKNTNYCEDITEFMPLKLKALAEHKTQLDSVAYDDLAESLGGYRGILNTGTKYAECFQIVKIESIH